MTYKGIIGNNGEYVKRFLKNFSYFSESYKNKAIGNNNTDLHRIAAGVKRRQKKHSRGLCTLSRFKRQIENSISIAGDLKRGGVIF